MFLSPIVIVNPHQPQRLVIAAGAPMVIREQRAVVNFFLFYIWRWKDILGTKNKWPYFDILMYGILPFTVILQGALRLITP